MSDAPARQRKPDWLKIRLNTTESYATVRNLVRTEGLHTVCEEARCPNLHECWGTHRTASFMILGDTCTRRCRFCAVSTGLPGEVDRLEPLRVAAAVPATSGEALRIAAYDDASGILSFLDHQADGTYRMGTEINVGTAPVRKILTGHFSSRATQDLVLCADRKVICLRAGGTWTLRQVAGFEPTIEEGRFGFFTMGDINNDGVPDVVLCEQNKYHVQILSFDGSGKLADADKFKVFEAHPHGRERQPGGKPESGEPRFALVQDLTGDGKNDLLVEVHDRIILYPQE
jgi:hypothetical protein